MTPEKKLSMMTLMMELFILLALTIITLVSLVLSYMERRDLLDRLMSRNIEEYKSLKEEPNQIEEEDDRLIPILSAKEEIFDESE